MRAWFTLMLLVGPVVVAGLAGEAGATEEDPCAQTIGEVTLGAGPPLPVPVPVLAGLAYEDVPFHSCSAGGFWLDDGSGNVQATRDCSEQVVRVWAVTGEAGQNYIINWKDAGKDDC